jgi:hypothetical protein
LRFDPPPAPQNHFDGRGNRFKGSKVHKNLKFLSSRASYLLQTLISPLIGFVIDRYGFGVFGIAVSVMPLFGLLALRKAISRQIAGKAASAATA